MARRLRCSTVIALVLGTVPTLAMAQFGPERVLTDVLINPSDVGVTDLDGDGDLDVMSTSDSRVTWWENLGGRRFGPTRLIDSSNQSAQEILAGDIDGDGDMDVIVLRETYGTVSWHENLGGGNFGPTRSVTTNLPRAAGLVCADLDGDDDLDLLATSAQQNRVVWFDNDGVGAFSSARVVSTQVAAPADACTGDIDGDGDLDVIAAALGDRTIRSWLNDGSGAFSTGMAIDVLPNRAIFAEAGDVDGDGDLDLVAASYHVYHGVECYWYAGDGAGSFGVRRPIGSVGLNFCCSNLVTLADLDGDDDLDVAICGFFSTSWYENLGGGSFGSTQSIQSHLPSNSLATGDLDDDGDPDLIVARPHSEVTWIESLYSPISTLCQPAATNSTGAAGRLRATGSASAAVNDLTLTASDLPRHTFGLFLTSRAQSTWVNAAGSVGTLCLSGQIGRFVGPGEIRDSGSAGAIEFLLDVSRLPTPSGAVPASPGETWYFQCWYRDSVSAQPVSNLTDAVSVRFL